MILATMSVVRRLVFQSQYVAVSSGIGGLGPSCSQQPYINIRSVVDLLAENIAAKCTCPLGCHDMVGITCAADSVRP